MFFALGDDADKVADHHDGPNARDVRNRRFVDRLQRVADEVAVVRARIRRPDHAAVQHAGHAHIVHKSQLASGLGRNVDARRAGADQTVIFRRLDGGVQVQGQLNVLAGEQLGIVEWFGILRRWGRWCRLGQQPSARLRRRRTQWQRMNLNRCAGDGRTLVRCARGVAQDHVDAVHANAEFFRHDLRQRRAQPCAQVDVTTQRSDAAVVPDGQQYFWTFGRIAADQRRLPFDGRRCWRWFARDQQHTASCMKVSAGERCVECVSAGHGAGAEV